MRTIPGELLLRPLAIASAVLLVTNDQLLKHVWPGFVTGKLSDFAGLIMFPLLLVSLVEFVRLLARQRIVVVSDAVMWTAICGLGFILVKCTPLGNNAYAWVVGAVRWPFHALVALVQHEGVSSIQPILVARDPTDLFALIVLPLPYILIRARLANSQKRCAQTPVDLRSGECAAVEETTNALN